MEEINVTVLNTINDVLQWDPQDWHCWKVRAYVLKTMLSKQRQGNWFHQVKQKFIGRSSSLPSICAGFGEGFLG
nr:hypothetical protein [Tanacetum cinerariifolium]